MANLKDSLGIFSFEKNESSSLKDRIKLDKKDPKMKPFITKVFHAGNGNIFNEYSDFLEYSIKRDFGWLNKEGIENMEPQFVPDGYIPQNPKIVDPLRRKDIEKMVEDKKMIGQLRASKGEEAEKEFYFKAREYFKNRTERVFFIQGVDMLQFDPEKRKKKYKSEFDFIVVNLDQSYIMNIEVKSILGTDSGKSGKSSLNSGLEQIETCRQFMQDWFGSDLSQDWRFIGILFTPKAEEGVKEKCQDFIIEGEKEVQEKLDKIHEFLRNERTSTFENHPEEFIFLVKHLLYSACLVQLPIGGHYEKMIKKAMDEVYDIKNIELWCWATPEQQGLMKRKRIVFCAPFGSGKTLFLSAKALELDFLGEKVIVLIFQDWETEVKSLLALELEDRFKNCPNIKVQIISFNPLFSNNLENQTEDYENILIDEAFPDLTMFENSEGSQEFQKALKKQEKNHIWVSPSNDFFGVSEEFEVSIEEKITKWFPSLEVIRMNQPLRYTQRMLRRLKEVFKKHENKSFNAELMANSKLPPNISEGINPIEMERNDFQTLNNSLKNIFESKSLDNQTPLIVIAESRYSKLLQRFSRKINCQKCLPNLPYVIFSQAIQSIGKEKPLFHCLNYSSGEESVKAWIRGDAKNQALVVSDSLIHGFETDTVIDTTESDIVQTRASLRMISTSYSEVLSLIMANDFILTKEHECDKGIDLEVDVKMKMTFEDFLAKKLKAVGFYMSPGSPKLYEYSKEENPIFQALSARMTEEGKIIEGFQIRDMIYDFLEKDLIHWKSNSISKDKWLGLMKEYESFYRFEEDFSKLEDLLLDFCSRVLQRQIILLSSFDVEEMQLFPMDSSSYEEKGNKAPPLHLIALREAQADGFFGAIFPFAS